MLHCQKVTLKQHWRLQASGCVCLVVAQGISVSSALDRYVFSCFVVTELRTQQSANFIQQIVFKSSLSCSIRVIQQKSNQYLLAILKRIY